MKLCQCGCGIPVEKSKSKSYLRKYANGHEKIGKIINYIIPKTKVCNKCKIEKEINDFSFRNYIAPNGLQYSRPRSRCKICECNTAHETWYINPEKRKRKCEQKRNDRSLKSHIQNRIASWRKKTPSSDLTTEYLLQQCELQNGKCYYTGLPLEILKIFEWKDNFVNSISLDRLDPNKGYIQGNVVFCLYSVNTMKGKLTEQEFYERLRQILQNRDQLFPKLLLVVK
jgi:hypothetical protein